MSNTVTTLFPAYNQHYPSVTIAKTDFIAGRSFKTRDGTHVTILDFPRSSLIRLKLPSSSILFRISDALSTN